MNYFEVIYPLEEIDKHSEIKFTWKLVLKLLDVTFDCCCKCFVKPRLACKINNETFKYGMNALCSSVCVVLLTIPALLIIIMKKIKFY